MIGGTSVRAPCRYGGSRPFFLCPNCGRLYAKLHGAGRLFLCRLCYDLAYASQREPKWDRLIRRANKLRARIAGATGMAVQFPPRPKGMWRRTYDRLCDEILQAEDAAEKAFITRGL